MIKKTLIVDKEKGKELDATGLDAGELLLSLKKNEKGDLVVFSVTTDDDFMLNKATFKIETFDILARYFKKQHDMCKERYEKGEYK